MNNTEEEAFEDRYFYVVCKFSKERDDAEEQEKYGSQNVTGRIIVNIKVDPQYALLSKKDILMLENKVAKEFNSDGTGIWIQSIIEVRK